MPCRPHSGRRNLRRRTQHTPALPAPCFFGFDTLATLEYILHTGYDYTWFVLTQAIIEKEFALSGSKQNPDLSSRVLGNDGAPVPGLYAASRAAAEVVR